MTRAGAFVGFCAVGIPAWWLALHYSPVVRELFVPAESWRGFQVLLVPDLLLAVACGLLASQLAGHDRTRAVRVPAPEEGRRIRHAHQQAPSRSILSACRCDPVS